MYRSEVEVEEIRPDSLEHCSSIRASDPISDINYLVGLGGTTLSLPSLPRLGK